MYVHIIVVCCIAYAKYFVELVPGFCKIVVSINFTLKAL